MKRGGATELQAGAAIFAVKPPLHCLEHIFSFGAIHTCGELSNQALLCKRIAANVLLAFNVVVTGEDLD